MLFLLRNLDRIKGLVTCRNGDFGVCQVLDRDEIVILHLQKVGCNEHLSDSVDAVLVRHVLIRQKVGDVVVILWEVLWATTTRPFNPIDYCEGLLDYFLLLNRYSMSIKDRMLRVVL